MSKEMTAEEYKEHFDQGLIPFIRESTKTYGDLRAKEAVKEFAEELIRSSETWQNQAGDTDNVVSVIDIKHLVKDKGIKI